MVARLVGRDKSSGAEVERTWAYIWTLRNGKALRMNAYSDLVEALEVVGLPE